MTGIDDQGVGGKIGQPGGAGAVEPLPGRAAVQALPDVGAAEGGIGRVDDRGVLWIEDERGDEAVARADRRPWSAGNRAQGVVATHDEALTGAGETATALRRSSALAPRAELARCQCAAPSSVVHSESPPSQSRCPSRGSSAKGAM